ncbi:alanine dehydrogenase [Uliginosibacterium sp. 31-16]|uniref:alanine dehydrogenase n=1 Tax=Uliginosibacterium sp. 31-16 TaxID=3068315 RepID=UPI00273EE353|nr:alanine dehydrogenase [Uliginosibacterium sp. 31-16]MDP5240501.1 alanine dehydrogenase [Uliginosibacterium sp. 31-16]
MLIGVPREIKNHEYRVGLTPPAVRELVARGHELLVETGAGEGISASDDAYRAAGARIAASGEEVFGSAQMIVKVKEPQAIERTRLRPGQILFTYLHLAPDPEQVRDLMASGAVCIAYETVTAADGSLPLLAPMSEVAGRMSVQAGAHCLEKAQGGRGVLLSGVPGVEPARVAILGGGVVGSGAALVAAGMGADVTVLDRSPAVLRRLAAQFGPRIKTLYANTDSITAAIHAADLVIGAVLVPGATAPRLITRAMLSGMQPGSVIVDVAIDQGGCCETSRPTTHAEPSYIVDGIVHYCVANMPGAVARTATYALTAATLPFVIALADKGWQAALRADIHLRNGLNVCAGQIACAEVAEALHYPHSPAEQLLRA